MSRNPANGAGARHGISLPASAEPLRDLDLRRAELTPEFFLQKKLYDMNKDETST
jgi:hypothetical protein